MTPEQEQQLLDAVEAGLRKVPASFRKTSLFPSNEPPGGYPEDGWVDFPPTEKTS
jgi:hypothetical protein